MKILIIAHGRSGSSNLLKSLGNVLKLKLYGEPFNLSLWKTPVTIDINSDCIIKTLAEQVPNNEDPVEFYTEYVKNFDITILLLRKNKKETTESLTTSMDTNIWHELYRYIDIEITEYVVNLYNTTFKIINTLSDTTNLPITYYENLYSGDITVFTNEMKKIGLEKYTEELFPYFNPKNRYRQFKKLTII